MRLLLRSRRLLQICHLEAIAMPFHALVRAMQRFA
jgi:hypothetical protein